jgi:hypothetical protein
VKKLKPIAIMKNMMIDEELELSVPAIATIINLKMQIDKPLSAVPIVNLDTTDSDK